MNVILPCLNRNISFAREIKERLGVGSSYLDRRRRLSNENVRHYRYTLYNIIRGYGYFFHSPLLYHDLRFGCFRACEFYRV